MTTDDPVCDPQRAGGERASVAVGTAPTGDARVRRLGRDQSCAARGEALDRLHGVHARLAAPQGAALGPGNGELVREPRPEARQVPRLERDVHRAHLPGAARGRPPHAVRLRRRRSAHARGVHDQSPPERVLPDQRQGRLRVRRDRGRGVDRDRDVRRRASGRSTGRSIPGRFSSSRRRRSPSRRSSASVVPPPSSRCSGVRRRRPPMPVSR